MLERFLQDHHDCLIAENRAPCRAISRLCRVDEFSRLPPTCQSPSSTKGVNFSPAVPDKSVVIRALDASGCHPGVHLRIAELVSILRLKHRERHKTHPRGSRRDQTSSWLSQYLAVPGAGVSIHRVAHFDS